MHFHFSACEAGVFLPWTDIFTENNSMSMTLYEVGHRVFTLTDKREDGNG